MGFCELSTDSSRKATAAKVASLTSSALYPALHGLRGGSLQGFARVMAERIGIGDALAVAAQALNGSETS